MKRIHFDLETAGFYNKLHRPACASTSGKRFTLTTDKTAVNCSKCLEYLARK